MQQAVALATHLCSRTRRQPTIRSSRRLLSFDIISPSLTPADEQNHGSVLISHDETSKIITVTLNSPSTYNALTVEIGEMFRNKINFLRTNLHDGSIRNANVCILKGSGKAFSSGGSLDWLRSRRDVPAHINADIMMEFYKSFLCIRTLQIPVIAAIHGSAIGAGACLALACDLRVAARDTRIGFNFVSLGIHAGMGASHFLPKTIGRTAANEALLTGKTFLGPEAYQLGLVNRLVDTPQEVLTEAIALATEVANQNPLSVRTMIRSIRMQEDELLEVALRREADVQSVCYAHREWGEGLNAVVEKRKPQFTDYHDYSSSTSP